MSQLVKDEILMLNLRYFYPDIHAPKRITSLVYFCHFLQLTKLIDTHR